ncbi:MAG TPA: OsmC family protein [Herbaspirillum sp.]|jgi:osmotically inducible protein OsmC
MIKKASAVWKGSLKEGGGTISTETGVLDKAPYGFKARFENGKGTNPEELIGAAHAGCFSMALSMILGEAGLTPEIIETQADVTLEKLDSGFEISMVHLTVSAKVPGASKAQFDELAAKAKAGCPVSKLLKAEITMDAQLAP